MMGSLQGRRPASAAPPAMNGGKQAMSPTPHLAAIQAKLAAAPAVQRLGMFSAQARGGAAAGRPAVVQGRFVGALGPELTKASPAYLGHGADTSRYATYWNALQGPANLIEVVDGPPRFQPATGPSTLPALFLGKHMLDVLLDQDPSRFDQATFASYLSAVTHELVHAVDSTVQNRMLRREDGNKEEKSIFRVIDTELRAWKNEAQVQEQLMPDGQKDTALVKGWQGLRPGDITGSFADAKAAAAGNEVMDRYVRYVERECRAYCIDIAAMNEKSEIVKFTEDWHVQFSGQTLAAMKGLATTFGNTHL